MFNVTGLLYLDELLEEDTDKERMTEIINKINELVQEVNDLKSIIYEGRK